MYQPAVGRFLSRDPLTEAGGAILQYSHEYVSYLLRRELRLRGMRSQYHYVSNNPINAVDPTGLQEFPPTDPKMNLFYKLDFFVSEPVTIPLDIEVRIDPSVKASIQYVGPVGIRRLPPINEQPAPVVSVRLQTFAIDLKDVRSLPPEVQLGLQNLMQPRVPFAPDQWHNQPNPLIPWENPVGGGTAEALGYVRRQIQSSMVKQGGRLVLDPIQEWAKKEGSQYFDTCPEVRGRGNTFQLDGFKFDPKADKLWRCQLSSATGADAVEDFLGCEVAEAAPGAVVQ